MVVQNSICPQPDNGYIRIANELAEALARLNLSAYESRILWCIFRKTYGWNKKSDVISYSQFEDTTGMDRRHIGRAIRSLAERKIIWLIHKGAATVEYGIQKNYMLWEGLLPKEATDKAEVLPIQAMLEPEPLPKEAIATKKEVLPKEAMEVLPKEATEVLPKEATTKDNIKTIKDNTLSKDNAPSFDGVSQKEIDKKILYENTKLVFEGLKKKRGINSPAANAEAVAIRWMLNNEFSVDDILTAYDKLKQDSFWEAKFLHMQTVRKEINDVLKSGGNNGSGKGFGKHKGYNAIPTKYTTPEEFYAQLNKEV